MMERELITSGPKWNIMENSSPWEALGWFIATVGIGFVIIADTPGISLFGRFDSIYLGLVVYNIGIMGRSLAAALKRKPNIMSAKYIYYTWCLPFTATFVGIDFVRTGEIGYITAMLIVIGVGSVYSYLVGEIEPREEYTRDETPSEASAAEPRAE